MKAFSTLVALVVLSNISSAEAKILLKAGTIDSRSQFTAFSEGPAQETGLYLIECKQAIHESDKAAVRGLGLTVLDYIPDNTLLVKGNAATASKALQLSFVIGILPFQPGYKMEPTLGWQAVFAFATPVDISVTLAPSVDLDAIRAQIGSGLLSISKTRAEARMNLGDAWKLAERSDVLWIEKRLPIKNFDFIEPASSSENTVDEPPPAYTGFESGTKILNVDAAYAAGIHGEGMLTGFADTGLDKGDQATLVADFQGQVASASNIALYGTTWNDPNGHGTHVAGSIAGNGASSQGKIRGGAYKAKLVVEGMWSDMVDNIFPPEMPKIFGPAYDAGARIHSNSWGASASGRYDSNAAAVDQFMFQHQDFLILFAAGNDGQDGDQNGVVDEGSLASPGSAKNALTIGASKNYVLEGGIQKTMKDLRDGAKKWGVEPLASSKLSDDPQGMAGFSSRGPAADGRIKPDVVAPGTNIVSVRSTDPKASASNGAWGPDYVFLSGTSMATPLSNGALTLVRQYLVSQLGAAPSAALLKATVANTAKDLFPGQFGTRAQGQEQPSRRPNNHEGWGRIDLEQIIGQKSLRFFDERAGLSTGQEKTFDVKVSDTNKGLHITMAYTDAPGAASAAKALVNDLDLVVVDPVGNRLYPNRLAAKDNTNNMEQVDVDTPKSGVYHVSVQGANVPSGINGAQPYALVVSGGI